jgi:imidazolonepropionase-like amidohydrolase
MARPEEEIALVGGTVYASPTDQPLRDAVVLIRDGRIARVGVRSTHAVPADAHVLDCSGAAVMAGFWNSHVHFFERKWADVANIPARELSRQIEEMLTRYGFTTVFDLASLWVNTRQLRDRVDSGEARGPRIRSTGEGLVPPGALPPDVVMNLLGVMKTLLPEVSDAAQAKAAARQLLEQGVDGIKIFQSAGSPSIPPLPENAVRAAADEAHRVGKPVFVHPNNAADVLAAVRNGVDVVAHTTPQSGPWGDDVIGAMKEAGAALIPTLQIWKYQKRHDRLSVQEQFVGTAIEQLRAWVRSGGTVLFGTDLGAVEYDPTDEYALMAQAGMDFRQILASLTTAPAARFAESERLGRVADGFEADLTVCEGDPARDVRALAAVRYTLRSGNVIYANEEMRARR